MKNVLLILLIGLFGLISSIKAQSTLDSSGLADQTSLQMDKWRNEYNKYKEHIIPTDSIKPNWLKIRIGFNYRCDTVSFYENYYSLQSFNQEFKKFLSVKSNSDTVVLQIDHGNNLNIYILLRSFQILDSSIDRCKGHGTYYFSIYPFQREKQKYVKTDTIIICMDNIITYNGANVKKHDLSDFLQKNKPERIIIQADKELPIQDLIDVLQLGNDLKIRMILESKK